MTNQPPPYEPVPYAPNGSWLDRFSGRDTRSRCVVEEDGRCPFLGVRQVVIGETAGVVATVRVCRWHAGMMTQSRLHAVALR